MELSEATPLTADELQDLPIFPLPRVVFFPGSILPLHLFEPRYRELVQWCMTDGPRAMAISLLQPGYEQEYDARPAIHSIAGAGRIVAHREHPDGTHDIVLQGLTRVRLEEKPPERSFRIAKATVLTTPPATIGPTDMTALFSCAASIATVVREEHPDFELGFSPNDPPHELIDAIADRFVADAAKRQTILEALDLSERLAITMDTVGELLALLATHHTPS